MTTKSEYNKIKRAEMKRRGICIKCWKRPAAPGHAKCETCLTHDRLNKNDKYNYKVIDLR